MLQFANKNSKKVHLDPNPSDIKKILKQLLDFEKLKYCNACGICTASCPISKLLPEHYNPRILLQHIASGDIRVLHSPELWLCAWCYQCYRKCPQNLKLPEIFQAVRKFAVECGFMEGFYKALEIIKNNIPLPVSCLYVCFHPDRAIKNKQIITDSIQKAVLTNRYQVDKKGIIIEKKTKKIAIIGSGPAGLSAAHYLTKEGYSVTIFEALPLLGGMLRRCIPQYRLPKKLVDFDIMFIKDLVELKTNSPIGKLVKMKNLIKEGYAAIFLAIGSNQDKSIKIEGQELTGVFHALSFLEKANKKEIELFNEVSVIGGGNVAVDSARTALRHGAKEVTILYRRSKDEIPASPWEIKEAMEEGVKFEYLVSLKKIVRKNGKVNSIKCVKNKLGEIDKTGRRHPIPIKGSDFIRQTDAVIIAIGQFPNTVFLPNDIEISKQKTIETDPFTLETTSSNIFAGGDVVLGSGTLMEAILAGKQVACSIDCYLKNIHLNPIEIAEKTFQTQNGDY